MRTLLKTNGMLVLQLVGRTVIVISLSNFLNFVSSSGAAEVPL